jgi:hypothetical protein
MRNGPSCPKPCRCIPVGIGSVGWKADLSVVIAPWTDYKKAGPLLFSLDHQSKADDVPVHIFFSNVAVKVTGSENWINAQ